MFAIQGAVFEVYRAIGAGLLEAIYQESLAFEFEERRIPFLPQLRLPAHYKGRPLRQSYMADFVCFHGIIIELKAARECAPEHRAQVINYLKMSGLRLGLLVNFGATPKVGIERFAL